MADFRKALRALGTGRLNPIILAESIDKLLMQQPQLADILLKQLAEARDDGTITDDQYRAVRECITSLSYNPAGRADPPATPLNEEYAPTSVRTLVTGLQSNVRQASFDPPDDDDRTVFMSAPPATGGTRPAAHSGTGGFTGAEPLDLDLSGPWPDSSSPSLDVSLGSTSNFQRVGGAEGSNDQPLGPGTVLNEQFVLEEQIGRGGMGAVFKARDLLLVEAQDRNPYVAIKLLNEDFKRHPKAFIALAREASRQGQLGHPNIVKVNTFARDRSRDVIFISMELLEGVPLNRFIAERRQNDQDGLTFKEAFPIVKALGEALQFAHDRGVVHSDFKPGNCFICRDGTVKVLDFGIARAIPGAGVGRDGAGEHTVFRADELGALTVPYASLEMLDGKEPDNRDDLYALACVAYELLALKHPYGKLGANKALEKRMVPKPIKGLTKRQMAGLSRGLAFERENRSPDIKIFLRELEGQVEPWRNPWIIAPVAAVLLGLPAAFLIREGLERAALGRIDTGITAQDPLAFENSLDGIAALDDDVRRLFVEKNLPQLETQFEQRVTQYLDKHDFSTAEKLLTRGDRLRSSWGVIGQLRERLKQQRAQRVLVLRGLLNECALDARCLAATVGEQSFARLLGELRGLDPQDGLLGEATVAIRYADQVRGLFGKADLPTAAAVLGAGLALLPGNTQLTALQRDLAARQEAQTTEQEIAGLEKQLNALMPTVKGLDDAAALVKLTLELGQLDPEHAALTMTSAKFKPLVETGVKAMIANREWPALSRMVDQLKPASGLLGLSTTLERATQALARFEAEVDQRFADLNTAIAAKELLTPASRSAIARYADLTTMLGSGTRLDNARTLVQAALVRQARQALAQNDFNQVKSLTDATRTLGETTGVEDDLARLNEDLTLAQSTEQSAEKERVLKARVERLGRAFTEKLAALDTTPASITSLLGVEDELTALVPTHPILNEAKPKIEARLIEIAQAAGASEDFAAALGVLDAAAAANFQGSPALAALRSQLEKDKAEAQKSEADTQLAQAKGEVDKLITEAKFDTAWQKKLERALATTAAALPTGDAWLPTARQRIVTAHVEEIGRQIEGKNFARAKALLEQLRQKPYDATPDQDQLALLQNNMDSAETEWQATREVAELDSRKAEIKTLIEATKLSKARIRWDDLQTELPAADPFRADAQQRFAEAYLALAQSRVTKEPGKALEFAKEGLRVAPNFAPLLTLTKELLEKSTAAALETVKTKDPAQSGATAALGQKFADALATNKLTAAQTLLDAAPLETRSSPEYATAVDSLRQKRQLAEAGAAQATTTTQQGDPAAAAQALAAAKDLWRDRPDGEWPNLASAAPRAGPGPATPPSKAPATAGGVPCTPNLAGKGKSARAVCYDRIGDQFQGPPLVVVPAGGGGGSFAIGRYEVSFEDFNQYCTASAACQSLGGDRRAPVTGIPLESAMSYLSWLSAQTGHKYRLPTAGEWEHAATSGGASTDKNYNCRLVVNGTVMKGQGSLNVKSGRPNPWGLYNAVGNVQEWIDGGKVRGGAFDDAIEECAPTLEKDHAGTPDDFTGFRAVRDLG